MIGDTIAAVSTPRGKGGVALLRVSGPEAVSIAERVFVPGNGKKLSEEAPRTSVWGHILGHSEGGERRPIDDGMATVFYAPRSFTGEDTVEICCHGGILLTEKVLTSLLSAGARAATAGEFTRRAFLNGKLGLASAEALGNMLEACTDEQLTLAHTGLSGAVDRKCREVYDSLKTVLASIYAKIDYPDEDLADLSREEMEEKIQSSVSELTALEKTYRTGHAIAEGIPTVICGKPNVGKSSLYNRLVGRDAAIVTDIEGTTRDVLTETAALGRVTLRLFDTAGIRETDNPVEKIGVERSRGALADAELILAVFDGSKAPDDLDRDLVDLLKRQTVPVLALFNKSDRAKDAIAPFYSEQFPEGIRLSAETGEGMDVLRDRVEELFTDGRLDTGKDAILSGARQHAAVLRALEAANRALSAIREGLPVDLACTDAEDAMESLAELDGRSVSEDIVSEIFSHFCVGK